MSRRVVSIGTAPGETPVRQLARILERAAGLFPLLVQGSVYRMSYQNWGPQDMTAPRKSEPPEVPVERGMVLEDVQSGWVGAVTRVEKSGGMHVVALEDRRGKSRTFRLGYGFLLEGRAHPADAPGSPRAGGPGPSSRTASGSVRVAGQRAQVAKASRIWVEGKHDAELVEKVWGDDLRVEGIVVEPLHGIDDLAAAVAASGRAPAAGWASWWTTWSRTPRNPGSLTPSWRPRRRRQRADCRPPLCGCVAGHPARGAGHCRVARHPARPWTGRPAS